MPRTTIAPIAVVSGETPAARAVAGAVASLLSAVGRWVERASTGDDLGRHAAVVLSSGRSRRAVRERYAGPLLVVDADLLDGRVDPAFARLLAGTASTTLTVHATRVVLPRPLPSLAGSALGDAPPGLAAAAGAALGYVLPIVLAPALRTVDGFWSLAQLVEEALAALVGADETLYVEPWPRGFRAARALSYDCDGLEALRDFPSIVANGRPATFFCCADILDRVDRPLRNVEIAAHGDVHRPFKDARTDVARIDRMLATFHAAGLTPRGFSPPTQNFAAPRAELIARFSYLRMDYQERVLRFHPERTNGAVVAAISYYPDTLHRYVGAAEYTRLLGRFLAWAEATSTLAVPCFHPCLWTEPLRRYLDERPGDAWEATLTEVSDWWLHRARALAAIAADGEAAAPADVVLVRARSVERLARLRPLESRTPEGTRARGARRLVVGGRPLRVVPAADGPVAPVEVPLGAAWRALGWLPRSVRRRLVRVVNKNGIHAALYRDLGFAPEVVRGGLRLPIVAADEPIMLVDRIADVRDVARRVVRRLGRALRSTRAPHA